MNIDRAESHFLAAKRAEARSPLTISSYERAFAVFHQYMPSVGDTDDLDAMSMRDWIHAMQDGERLKDVTVANYVRHFRAFTTWLVREEVLRVNPFARVKVPRFEQKRIKTMPDHEFLALLKVCDTSTDIGRRDSAMLLFLADTGVRISELTSLKAADLDLKARQAVVRGKGAKSRVVFFSPQTAMALTKYLTRRPMRLRDREYVFAGRRDKRFGNSGVSQRLKDLAEQAGVTGAVNPHSFRHTFATNYLRLGGDPHSLQRILGHSDVGTTIRNYAHLVTEDLRAKHDQFSPVAHLSRR